MLKDGPLGILAATISTYWATVLVLVALKNLRHGQSAGLLPRQRFERAMWFLMVPVIGAWIALPWVAALGRGLAVPAWAMAPPLQPVRCGAAGVLVLGYGLSLACWLRMGRAWSMAIVPGQATQLVTGGLYRWVRHPIYALSVLMMVASALVLPAPALLLVAAAHLVLMNLKARNEERHLAKVLGPSYVAYCAEVGRFVPRPGRRAA